MADDRLLLLITEMLDLPQGSITPETARADTPSWDSLSHLRLITALESEFAVSLTMDEIASIQTVGDLQKILDSRRSPSPS